MPLHLNLEYSFDLTLNREECHLQHNARFRPNYNSICLIREEKNVDGVISIERDFVLFGKWSRAVEWLN